MNILAPINDISLLPELIAAGADEFFFGFFNEKDPDLFGKYFELNRMSGYGKYANSFDIESAVTLIKQISTLGKDSYVTINSSGYTDEALERVREYIKILVEAGVTGCIVSCSELLEVVRQCNGKAVISCIGTAYNEADVRFYQALGATRIILPRDLSLSEVSVLKKRIPDMEYEVFAIRNGCILSDGNCLGLHRFEHGGICKDIRHSKKHIFAENESVHTAMQSTQDLYDNCLFKHACAACAIYRMLSIGITACKVVGRVDRPEQVIKDIQFIQKNRNIAQTSADEEEFFAKMILPEGYESICVNGYSCYFPEIENKRIRS